MYSAQKISSPSSKEEYYTTAPQCETLFEQPDSVDARQTVSISNIKSPCSQKDSLGSQTDHLENWGVIYEGCLKSKLSKIPKVTKNLQNLNRMVYVLIV